MKTFGFSLIELMVVIAIVAVLSAVAVPAYKTHINKVKVASVLPFARGLLDQALQTYNKTGAMPSSIPLEGATDLGYNLYVLNNMGSAYAVLYFVSSENGFGFVVALTGLKGVTGYTDPATVPQDYSMISNHNNSIIYAMRVESNGIVEVKCSSNLLDASVIPAACTCASAQTWLDTGVC